MSLKVKGACSVFKKLLFFSIAGLFIFGLGGCGKRESPKAVSLEKREKTPPLEKQPEKYLRFALGGMLTPKEGFSYYYQLTQYVGQKLGMPVKVISTGSYAGINAQLKSGDVDIAFVCGAPYVDGHDDFGLELLVAPQAYGDTVYYSYIIVHRDSPIRSFEELRGKTFAFMDPLSNSGKLIPTYMLTRMQETPESFFKSTIYTYAHDKSIKAVAQKVVDGAAVDSLIWEYANRINPEFTSKTKIVAKSQPCGIPPVVVRPNLDPEMKQRLQQIFLGAHEEEPGKQILKGMMTDKFVVLQDAAYNSIREMKAWVAKQKAESNR